MDQVNIDHGDYDQKFPVSKVSFENHIGSYLQDEQIIDHSPKKRKSQTLMNKTLENKEKANDLKLLETSDWSEEDTNKLLDIMEKLVRPNLQNRSYKVTLHKMKFDEVSNLMENKKSCEDCRQHFELLIAKINKVKSMAQIISETRHKMSTSTTVNKKSPYSLFWEENKDTICSMAKQNKLNVMKTSHQLWKELPEEEKLCYKEKSEKLKATNKQVQNVGEFVNPVNSPFQFFLKKYSKKYPSSSYAERRMKFTKMAISKKLKYIKKSFETLYLEKEALEKYAEMYSDKPTPKKNFYNYPSYEEVRHYYHSYLGLPEMPSKSIPLFAAKEAGVSDSKLIAAAVRFKNYDKDTQQEWHLKFTKAWKDYTEKLNEWIFRQDPRDVELMEGKWSFLTKIPKIGLKIKVKHGRIKSQEKKKAANKVFKEVVMPVTIHKFDKEPQVPSLSNMLLFDKILKKDGEVVEKSELMSKYKNLSEMEIKSIEERGAYKRKKFIKRIKRFVGDMTEDMRKLYLGLKRKKLISALKEDIFEEIYPDDQYPIYVKQLTIDNCETSKFEQNDISPPRRSGKRKLLPLESDMFDIEPQHKSISKSKNVEPIKTYASESEEHLADTLPESSPRKLKKRKNSLSPHKKTKNSESSSSASEDDNGSSAKVKKSLGSNAFSTQSPPKLRRKSSESSSDTPENEEKRNLSPEMSKNLEESSSEEEDVFEPWLSNTSFNNSH